MRRPWSGWGGAGPGDGLRRAFVEVEGPTVGVVSLVPCDWSRDPAATRPEITLGCDRYAVAAISCAEAAADHTVVMLHGGAEITDSPDAAGAGVVTVTVHPTVLLDGGTEPAAFGLSLQVLAEIKSGTWAVTSVSTGSSWATANPRCATEAGYAADMSAPAYVPGRVNQSKAYTSPPRRSGGWRADRPGEVVGTAHPAGAALGNQGPDQGYILKLAADMRDDLVLTAGEHADDALVGASAVALRRASLYGRGPMAEDLRVALTLFGYLGTAPDELVTRRRELFDEVHHSTIHYFAAREIAYLVPEATLRLSLDEVTAACQADWKAPLSL